MSKPKKQIVQEFLEQHAEPSMEHTVECLDKLIASATTARDALSSGAEVSVTEIMEDVHVDYENLRSADWALYMILHLYDDSETL